MNQDLLGVLLEDHWYLERLLDRLDREGDPDQAHRLVTELRDAFERHEATERELVDPILGIPHADIGELVALLDALRLDGPHSHGFRKRAASLVLGLQAHLQAEEALVIPALRAALTPLELARMGALAVELRHRADLLAG